MNGSALYIGMTMLTVGAVLLSETAIYRSGVKGALDIVDNSGSGVGEETARVELLEIGVGDGVNDCVEPTMQSLDAGGDDVYAVLMLDVFRIGPRVEDGDVRRVFLQSMIDVDNLEIGRASCRERVLSVV